MVEAKSAEVPRTLRSPRKAVLVLGMHRSGTSALTRVLSLLGLDLPTRLMPAQSDNRLGHWESIELMELHDQALASCDSWWGDWRSIPREWFGSDDCRRFGDRLGDILRRDFANSTMFVVKDPRACRLAPLWLQTLDHLEIEPLVVITVRHPAEVAASLAIRNGFDPLMSNLVWLRHVLDAERYTRRITRSVVRFDVLLNNWRSTMSKIGEDLRIEWPIDPVSAAAAIERFLSPADRHHSAHRHCSLPTWVAAAYEGLLSEAEEDRKRWGPQRWARLHSEVDRAAAIFGSLLTTKDVAAAALRAELQKSADEAAALRTELQKSAEQVTVLRSEIEVSQQAAIQQASSIAELTENIRTLNATCDAAGRKIEALKTDYEQARGEVLALLNSTSWRITAPLRVIVELLRKIHFR